jgi:hypothetical protein
MSLSGAANLGRGIPLKYSRDGFQPPSRSSAGTVTSSVKSRGDGAQCGASTTEIPDFRKGSLFGRVGLKMTPVSRQPGTKFNIAYPFAFATFVP